MELGSGMTTRSPSSASRKKSTMLKEMPRADIEQNVVCVDLADTVQQASFLKVLQVRGREVVVGPTDEPEIVDTSIDDDVVDAIYPFVDEVGQRSFGSRQSETGMEIRSAEIGVDHNDSLAALGKANAKTRRDQALSNAAFATADRDDIPIGRGLDVRSHRAGPGYAAQSGCGRRGGLTVHRRCR